MTNKIVYNELKNIEKEKTLAVMQDPKIKNWSKVVLKEYLRSLENGR